MNRRTFLKAAAVAACAPLVLAPAAAEPQFAFATCLTPRCLFQQVNIEAGQFPEFPLDFIPVPRTGATLSAYYGQPAVVPRADWVLAPTFEVAAEADTVSGLYSAIHAKLDLNAHRLLLAAGQDGNVLPDGTRRQLVEAMRKRFAPSFVEFCEFEGWLIGVKVDTECLVMPARERFEDNIFDDTKGGHYCWGEYGMVVLNNSVVACGRIVE